MQTIILALFMFTQMVVSVTAGESYEDIGQLPEIEINAPRYRGEEADSIGMMPEIVVFGERYTPQNENVLFQTYTDYRTSYQSLFRHLHKYAVYILIAIFTLTWGIVAITKIVHLNHELRPREKHRKLLHEWVKRQQIKQLENYEIKQRRQ
ncbi:MAG: hypothetical protein WBB67_01650 [bacterium]